MGWFKRLLSKKNPDFKIGDDVICIDDRASRGGGSRPNVIYNETYKVLDVGYCDKCGSMALDVGLRCAGVINTRCNGDKCGTFPGRGIHWAGAFRFKKHITDSIEEKKENKNNLVKLEPQKVIRELEIHAN